MSHIEIKCFFSDNESSNNARALLRAIEKEYGDRVEITSLSSDDQSYQAYNLTATPAIIIEDMVKFVGFCPSKETFVSAMLSFG